MTQTMKVMMRTSHDEDVLFQRINSVVLTGTRHDYKLDLWTFVDALRPI